MAQDTKSNIPEIIFTIEGNKWKSVPADEFTCWTCKEVDTCIYAFDPYNLNGDCLALK